MSEKDFNYTVFDNDINYKGNPEYYGIHKDSGHLKIDLPRLKQICEELGETHLLRDKMFVSNDKYLRPARLKKTDYAYNIAMAQLNTLRSDWHNEYRPVLKMITTPEQVENDSIVDNISTMIDSSGFDDAFVNATLAKIKRMPKYTHVIRSLYASFISKIRIEVDRLFLCILVNEGYSQDDYDLHDLATFCDTKYAVQNAKILENLPCYDDFKSLTMIDNFIKHNTISAYTKLKEKYPHYVNPGTKKLTYQNGMYAVDWLVIPADYIDNLFNKLETFLQQFCQIILKEDTITADWNYEDYFMYIFKTLRYL